MGVTKPQPSLLGTLQQVRFEAHPCPSARQGFGPSTQNSLVLSLQFNIPVICLSFLFCKDTEAQAYDSNYRGLQRTLNARGTCLFPSQMVSPGHGA